MAQFGLEPDEETRRYDAHQWTNDAMHSLCARDIDVANHGQACESCIPPPSHSLERILDRLRPGIVTYHQVDVARGIGSVHRIALDVGIPRQAEDVVAPARQHTCLHS